MFEIQAKIHKIRILFEIFQAQSKTDRMASIFLHNKNASCCQLLQVVHMQQIYNTFRTIYETESIPRKRCLCTLLRSWLFPSSSKFNPKISCFKCANKNIWLKWKRPKVNCGESRKKSPNNRHNCWPISVIRSRRVIFFLTCIYGGSQNDFFI